MPITPCPALRLKVAELMKQSAESVSRSKLIVKHSKELRQQIKNSVKGRTVS